ncbi:hypothetical protein QOT17_021376 [Balamuthia mandrillaris]
MLLNQAQPVKEDFQQQVWGAKKLLFVYISLNLLGLIVASYLLIKGVSFYFSVLCLMATCTLLFQLFMLYALASCSFTAVLVGEILLGVWMLVTAVMAVVIIGTVTFVTSNFILFYHNDNDDSEEKHKESQRWSKMFGFLAVSIVVFTIGFGPFLIVQVCIISISFHFYFFINHVL